LTKRCNVTQRKLQPPAIAFMTDRLFSSRQIHQHGLSLLQKILLATDGTVTDLVALYTAEPIRVKKLTQSIRQAVAPAQLQCVGATELLHRQILLCGATRNYLYADSLFVFGRFSASIRQQLLETDKPIGLMWKEERLETYREIVDQRVAPCADIAQHFELPATAEFVSRTYLIYHQGKPLGSITERWPASYFRQLEGANSNQPIVTSG
jgi:chorismate-pyruvate lyase